MSRESFDRLAAALFAAMGLGSPFGEDLPPEERAFARHHGDVGECWAPGCGACEAARRDAAVERWRERWADAAPPAVLREIERAGGNLPDPRSRGALDLALRARRLAG